MALLQLCLGTTDGGGTAHHEGGQHGLQVGTGREHLVGRPDHQSLVVLFGQSLAFEQAFDHTGADGVHLGLDAGNQHPAS
jgi:hypothetical protein